MNAFAPGASSESTTQSRSLWSGGNPTLGALSFGQTIPSPIRKTVCCRHGYKSVRLKPNWRLEFQSCHASVTPRLIQFSAGSGKPRCHSPFVAGRERITMKVRLSLLLVLIFVFGGALAAGAEDKVEAVGRILASDGKTPLQDAMIAVYDEQGKVIAHGKTDSEGRYRIPVPRSALHLVKKRSGSGFLGGLLKGVGSVVNVAAGL